MFKDKTILITGGTGSFGNAVMERVLHTNIREIRIFSRDEKKQDDMRRLYKDNKLKFYIGDVRDISSIKNAIHNLDYIFHAAALKQVPSCEFFPLEAVKTNVIGTDNVLTAAIEFGIRKVICLSTDKAAYPINAMGISKAMMEKVFIAKSRTVNPDKTLICGTRYGNVMASRGSVIPLFIEQIKSGQPLTITDPNMTRFLMSLNEAVELVVFAFQNAIAGDMSIVGPRPLLAEYLSLYNKHQKRRHEVRPGLSGLAQASGRNAISWEDKFDLDIEYVDNITFFGDWSIILKTIKKVFIKEGISSDTSATMEDFMGTVISSKDS